jgi:hypothetical protein
MPRIMKKQILFVAFITGMAIHASSQENSDTMAGTSDRSLSIYLDCPCCDMDYFRTRFTLVNYVTEQRDADVYILVTDIGTGSGGTEYRMILNGNNRFGIYKDTVVFTLPADVTQEVMRSALLKYTQFALVPFLMKTPARKHLSLYIDEETDENERTDQPDPWRSWTFTLSGSGRLYNEKTYRNYGITCGLYISKITPEIKLESNNFFEFDESRFRLYDNDTLIYSVVSTQKTLSSSNLFVKSLGGHCGIGGIASVMKSDYSNLDLEMVAGPAVEFNLFSYEDASQKQLRFLYAVKYIHSDYIDSTVYNRMQDDLFMHELHIKFMYIDQWGEVLLNLSGSSYLDDWSHYYAGFRAMAGIKIVKGLSFDISGGLSYIRNQISLKKGSVSAEEFLLGDREMQTNFNYNISLGLSFRFGSVFNNTVNPRFDM